MARTSLTDYLQVYPFWLMDVAPIEPLALPIFTPLLGFSAITAPELTTEIHEVEEANWFFTSKVIKRAGASNMTLMRASKWYDSDFYRWVMAAVTGNTGGRGSAFALSIGGATPRRNLLLVHYLSRNPIPAGLAAATGAVSMMGLHSSVTGILDVRSLGSASAIKQHEALTGAGVAAATGVNLGPFQYTPRLPAKAWVLYGCLPTRYKAGGDFDAMSSDISIQELEIVVEFWDEISLGSDAAPVAKVLAVADAVSAKVSR